MTLSENAARFLRWEAASRDTIDLKWTYMAMADDLAAGVMLSQIVYWHLPEPSTGQTKLRVQRNGHFWLAKAHDEWFREIYLTPDQARRALRILEDKELVITAVYKFAGRPTKHIRINWEKFFEAWDECTAKYAERFGKSVLGSSPEPKDVGDDPGIPGQKPKSLTETPPETPNRDPSFLGPPSARPGQGAEDDDEDDITIPEPTYVPVGQEFDDDGLLGVPKWKIPPPEAARYMAPFRRKLFLKKWERDFFKRMIRNVEANLCTQEWVDHCLEIGSKPRAKGQYGTRWSFAGFLKVVTDLEAFNEWNIRRANAAHAKSRSQRGDAAYFGATLEELEARYGEV